MSSTTPPSQQPDGHGPTVTDHDRIDFPKVITVGVVSLAIFAVASGWAYSILRTERVQLAEKNGVALVPSEVGKPEIGIVDQVPFDKDKRLEVWKAERNEKLHGYGWIDRQRGLIHVPIERAMQEVVAGTAPAAAIIAPASTTTTPPPPAGVVVPPAGAPR